MLLQSEMWPYWWLVTICRRISPNLVRFRSATVKGHHIAKVCHSHRCNLYLFLNQSLTLCCNSCAVRTSELSLPHWLANAYDWKERHGPIGAFLNPPVNWSPEFRCVVSVAEPRPKINFVHFSLSNTSGGMGRNVGLFIFLFILSSVIWFALKWLWLCDCDFRFDYGPIGYTTGGSVV